MRVLIYLCLLGAVSAQFNAYYKREKDGAEYDEYNNRIYKHFSDPSEYMRDSDFGRERRQIRRSQDQGALRLRKNRPLKPVPNRRNLRPTYDFSEVQEARATDRQGYVYNPIKQTKQKPSRTLRPVKKQGYAAEEVPRYQPAESTRTYYEPARVSEETSRYSSGSSSGSSSGYTAPEAARYTANEPTRYATSESNRYSAPAKQSYNQRPVYPTKETTQENSYEYAAKPKRNLERVYVEPQIEQLNEVYVEPEIVETRYREPQPQRQKIFERNADVVVDDQLEGESFQPNYTPYSAPQNVYKSDYVPVEQKSIEAAVAAGAAAYPGEGYSDPQRLSFQIHGQEGPHSYRFGYDTGVGYNRQFRYEERDQYGVLHGRYGYYDQEGKLQIVNYTADPKTGFHADGEHVPKPQY